MSYAARNRTLKAILSKAFAPHQVTVRGSRGTAYGWVSVNIAYPPKTREEARELEAKVWQIIRAAKIEIGTFGGGDPYSDYGCGSCIHINFDTDHLWRAEQAQMRA